MGNKVTYGLSNIHIAFVDETSTTGYKDPFHIPGAVQWTPTTRGENSSFSADNNGQYFEMNTNNGYTADMSVAVIPDAILAEMLGWLIDKNGGLLEIADGKPKKFALGFQVDGDQKNRKTWYYDVLASRPAKEHQTTGDTTEVAPDQLSVSVSPKLIGDKKQVKFTLESNESNQSVYDSFFNAVTFPEFDEEGGA